MIIRTVQVDVFRLALRKSFLRSMTEHLRRDFAADLARHGVADGQLEELVESHAAAAERYGIATEEHLRLYLECIAILGPEFDRKDPAVNEILTRTDAGADEKMSEINEYLVFGLERPR